MAAMVSRFWNAMLGRSELDVRALFAGVDGAGKTTLHRYLQMRALGVAAADMPAAPSERPVPPFGVELVTHENLRMQVWDVPVSLQHCYYANAQAVVFVIDAADMARFAEARDLVGRMLAEPQLAGAIFLILANKQDAAGAVPAETIAEEFNLKAAAQGRRWLVRGCAARTGAGVAEGLDWLRDEVRRGGLQ